MRTTQHPLAHHQPEFISILRRQRNHAADHGDAGRADLFEGILSDVADEGGSSTLS